jgi:hypothetical protein
MTKEAVHPPVDELTVSRAWHAGWLRADRLRTTDGQPITIVYRGRWTFGFGPDFRGALIAFGAELRRGDVEIHLRCAGWREHGHHLNAAYNDVILHVVLDAEPHEPPCRRQDGATIPTLHLGPALRGPLSRLPHDPELPALGAVPDGQCVAAVTPTTGAAALERAGDARLTAKAALFEAAFTAQSPGQILYAGLLDALGYTRNRAGMAALAAALPLAMIEARLPARDPVGAFTTAAALLLGVGGFLPFTGATATLSGLSFAERDAVEATWAECGGPWRGTTLGAGEWTLARVRPANHPVRRLLGAAALLTRCGRLGLLAASLEPCTAEEPAIGLAELRALLIGPPRPGDPFGRCVGPERIAEIVNNIILPFALAYGAWSGDERLSGGAAALWEVAPASGGTEPTRALLAQLGGGPALKLRTGRQQQGALHLFRHYCEQRRCFECPLARLSRKA